MPELVQQLTEACGPGMPGPYRVVKEIGAAAAEIPPALRRHLPLTREAGSGGVKTPPYGMEDSMAADAKCAGRACPAPTGSLKIYGRQWYRNPSGAAAPPPFDKGGRGICCPNNRNPPSDSVY